MTGAPEPRADVVIVDYGMGNLRSVEKALQHVGLTVELTSDPEAAAQAPALVLPGVGAFGDAADRLRSTGLDKAVKQAISEDRPFLGICLGLQLLFDGSDEGGKPAGLAVLPGWVRHLPAGVKIPHMGWNHVHPQKSVKALSRVEDGDMFYFVHSYHVVPEDRSVIATLTDHGNTPFVSSVARGSLFACQFHPEKSGAAGLKILSGFADLVKERREAA